MMKRWANHIHTWHSFDSLISPKKVVDLACRSRIHYLLICDHDSLAGSLAARSYAKENHLDVEIPVAAEYLTNIGDVIVVNISETFEKIWDQAELCSVVKKLGGYVILPHPFKGHNLDAIDYTHIDCIEVFNSRCTIDQNENAFELALQRNKRMVYGSDAHLLGDVLSVVSLFKGNSPFEMQTLPIQLRYTSPVNVIFTQLVKGAKTRDRRLFVRTAICLAKTWLKQTVKFILRLSRS